MAELAPMVIVTVWDAVDRPKGRRRTLSRVEVFDAFRIPRVTTDKHSLPGWAPTAFRRNYRNLSNVEAAFAIGLDIDKPEADLSAVVRALDGFSGFVYTTYSHTPEHHRARAIVWTSRPISAHEYGACWSYLANRTPGTASQASDASRLWFVPGIPTDREYRLIALNGTPLDVDEAIRLAPSEPPPPDPRPLLRLESLSDDLARLVERASRYLATMDAAIAGSHGHDTTWRAAFAMVRGFGLPVDEALRLLTEEYNPRCKPPWTENELRHKVMSAARSEARAWLAAPQGTGPSGGWLATRRLRIAHTQLDIRNRDPSRPPCAVVTLILSEDGERHRVGEMRTSATAPTKGYDEPRHRRRWAAFGWDLDPERMTANDYALMRRILTGRRVDVLGDGDALFRVAETENGT